MSGVADIDCARDHAVRAAAPPRAINLCASCHLRHGCLAGVTLLQQAGGRLPLQVTHRLVRRADILVDVQQPFNRLHVVRAGTFKSTGIDAAGRAHVTGFVMTGELIGLDGIAGRRHQIRVSALEDSVVCELPFAPLAALAQQVPALQQKLYKVVAQQIGHNYELMMMLGTLRVEQRVAAFLVNLSQRLAQRGYSGSQFLLRMTRREIASYLGMSLATASRQFSALQARGLITVAARQLVVRDLRCLGDAASHHDKLVGGA